MLTLAIVIVLNLFYTFAIRLEYKEPTYEKFCPQQQVNRVINTEKACLDVGGQWSENPIYFQPTDGNGQPIKAMPSSVIPGSKEPAGYCNVNYTCEKNFRDTLAIYNRNVFVILIILGVITLGIGYSVGTSAAVSQGLSLGGVLALIIASIRYWSDMDDLVRVIILAIALVTLIWFGIKKFKD